MGSTKKHKRHKSEKREKYEEYNNQMDSVQMQRGLKLILKVGPNNTPEYSSTGIGMVVGMGSGSGGSSIGPPTAIEAMCSSPLMLEGEEGVQERNGHLEEYRSEKHKKSKKKKKKKEKERDREKRHKHHKEKKRDKGESQQSQETTSGYIECSDDITLIASHDSQSLPATLNSQCSPKVSLGETPSSNLMPPCGEVEDSSQDGFSFMDEESSQPLGENLLFYAGITTESSPSCRPVTKPILPRKCDDMSIGSPTSSSLQSSSIGMNICVGSAGGGDISPSKLLSDVTLLSPLPSLMSSIPGGGGGGGSDCSVFPSKPHLEAPKTPSSSSDSGREPRSCVLKLKQQKAPLNKLLEHLLRTLEKRDPHQFFAWPVTDDIAPGYSQIISKPMDFSTMRQKIDENQYNTLLEFTDDFRLMCENAITYNHVDTVYHKAAKRLLQVGMKHLAPDSLMRSLKPISGYMRDLTSKELGFELLHRSSGGSASGGEYNNCCAFDQSTLHGLSVGGGDSADESVSTMAEETLVSTPLHLTEEDDKRKVLRLENQPKTRFEPYVDDMTSEEILQQVKSAARAVKKRLSAKERAHRMGFFRQNEDGTTSLNFLINDENEGPEKVVTLGDVVGKLQKGSNQIHSYREDKRNETKLVTPLHYGPFSSFAPTFDSRFSTLNKEETQLVMRTYGDATSTEYAESILQFTKDSSYATMLANGLLDVLTNGEHAKCMKDLYDLQLQNYEQQEALKCFNNLGPIIDSSASLESRAEIEQEYEKYKNTRIDFQRLRSLSEIGINVDFLDDAEKEMKNIELSRRLQEHLSNNLNLIDKLRNAQHERLSQPLPSHLALVPGPSQDEMQLAHQLTQQLADAAKCLPPAAIADPYSLRKAMGISFVGLPVPNEQQPMRAALPAILQTSVTLPNLNFGTQSENEGSASAPLNRTNNIAQNAATVTTTGEPENSENLSMELDDDPIGPNTDGDLENELREFLESGSSLHATTSSNSDDNNLVAQLLMN